MIRLRIHGIFRHNSNDNFWFKLFICHSLIFVQIVTCINGGYVAAGTNQIHVKNNGNNKHSDGYEEESVIITGLDDRVNYHIGTEEKIVEAAATATGNNKVTVFNNGLDTQQSQQPRISITNQRGRPLPSLTGSLKVGPGGPILLSDTNLIEHLAHFDRERIPERVVHAKGAGAHGYFEVTDDISKYTKAVVFNRVNKRTPVLVRFSTVGGELGSADTAHDPRGFALKFYTENGIWNLVSNNLPIFPIRDPILFPSLIHSRKRNPATHLKDPNMFWDFTSLRPESTFHTLMLFSDIGFPENYRFMNGAGVHTFKLVNNDGNVTFCKFHWLPENGLKNMTPDEAVRLAGVNPDYFTEDVYNAISKGDFPSWKFYIQVMTVEEAKKYQWNPFDITKLWREEDFPLIPVGKLVLNKNPKDFFTEIEMAAFDPGDLISGIEMSQDPMLIGRSFSYGDTQRYRLGPNFLQLPKNRPKNFYYNIQNPTQFLSSYTYQRDGYNVLENGNGLPNYWPNSFTSSNVMIKTEKDGESPYFLEGTVDRWDDGEDDNFSQAKLYYDSLSEGEQVRLAHNLATNLLPVMDTIREKTIGNFENVDKAFANTIKNIVSQLRSKGGKGDEL